MCLRKKKEEEEEYKYHKHWVLPLCPVQFAAYLEFIHLYDIFIYLGVNNVLFTTKTVFVRCFVVPSRRSDPPTYCAKTTISAAGSPAIKTSHSFIDFVILLFFACSLVDVLIIFCSLRRAKCEKYAPSIFGTSCDLKCLKIYNNSEIDKVLHSEYIYLY